MYPARQVPCSFFWKKEQGTSVSQGSCHATLSTLSFTNVNMDILTCHNNNATLCTKENGENSMKGE